MLSPGKLRDWREVRGLTQTALAAMLEKSWKTISNNERGVTPMSLEFRYAIAAIDRGLKPYGDNSAATDLKLLPEGEILERLSLLADERQRLLDELSDRRSIFAQIIKLALDDLEQRESGHGRE